MIENGTGAASEALVGKKANRTTTTPKLAVQKRVLMSPTPNYKLSIEVGNVFTNFVLLNIIDGTLYFEKICTTFPDSTDGILNGINLLLETYKVSLAHVRTVVHGTTFIKNSLVEWDGAEMNYINTKSFKKIENETELCINTGVIETTANAYLQPILDKYFDILEKKLSIIGFKGIIQILNSLGHVTTWSEARKMPIQLCQSGAAGGAMLGLFLSKMLKIPHLWTLDIGGRDAKSTFMRNGELERTHGFDTISDKMSPLPMPLGRINLVEMGAGGNAMMQLDTRGTIFVEQGDETSQLTPICYGLGDEVPTLTDADVVLGFLNENFFLGGKISLHKDLVINVLEEKWAKPFGISVAVAAAQMRQAVHENMAKEANLQLLERGLDPKTVPMMALGSAGAGHAFEIAQLLGAKQLIIPVGVGVASALGFLVSPVASESMMPYIRPLSNLNWQEINLFLHQAEIKGLGFLKRANISVAQSTVRRFVKMRYVEEEQEIMVALPNEMPIGSTSISTIEQNFDTAYLLQYGCLMREKEREVVALRVLVSGSVPNLPLKQVTHRTKHGLLALKGHRSVYFAGNWVECPVYDRYALRAGDKLPSPALIEEVESTIFIGSNATIHLDRFENIIVNLHY
jgi:N-methylhydantoinase A